MKTETPYFAVINPASKYSGQCEGIPFPVTFSPEGDGYHWKGNNDRYRDQDLIELYPCCDPTIRQEVCLIFDDDEPDFDYQEFLNTSKWFMPVRNRDFIKSPFSHINRSGKQISLS